MPKSNKPYFLKLRKDRLVDGKPQYECRFADEPKKRIATGETTEKGAIAWAEARLRGGVERTTKPKITLLSFGVGFFLDDTQGWVKRREARGHALTHKYLVCNEGYLVNHIYPYFGGRTLDSLTVREIDDCLIANPKSAATKNKVINALRIVLGEAKDRGLVKENVAASLKPFPEISQKKAIFSSEELHRLFPNDAEGLVAVWGKLSWGLFFRVLAITGMRPGEVAALQWQDYFPELGGLVVTKAIESGTGRLKGLKTEHSGKKAKAAMLDSETISLFREYKEGLGAIEPMELIFTVPATGNIIQNGITEKIFRGAMARAGLELAGRTPYSLRHTFQTRNVKRLKKEVVADMMGHTKFNPAYDQRTGTDLLEQYQWVRAEVGF